MSVFVALQAKQLPFELFAVDLATDANREERYAANSLTQRVPTLTHGDFALSESSAITEYLDDTFAETPVYPQDRHLRARARQLQAWLIDLRRWYYHGDIVPAPLVNCRFANDIFLAGATTGAPTTKAHKQRSWHPCMG